ncbi:hypothetical protein D3C72_2213290 [compost metagenome]
MNFFLIFRIFDLFAALVRAEKYIGMATMIAITIPIMVTLVSMFLNLINNMK